MKTNLNKSIILLLVFTSLNSIAQLGSLKNKVEKAKDNNSINLNKKEEKNTNSSQPSKPNSSSEKEDKPKGENTSSNSKESPASYEISSAEAHVKYLNRKLRGSETPTEDDEYSIQSELDGLQKKINTIKQKDPSCSKINSFESDYKDFKQKYEAYLAKAHGNENEKKYLYEVAGYCTILETAYQADVYDNYVNKKIDFDKLSDAMMNNPTDAYAVKIKTFLDNYENTFKKNVESEVKKLYMDANNGLSNTSQMSKGQGSLNDAMKFMNAANKLAPNKTSISTLYKQGIDLETKYANNLDKNVFKSTLHKTNVNKVLFFDRPTKIGEEHLSKQITEITPNQNIYAIAYYDDVVANRGDAPMMRDLKYVIYIDDNEVNRADFMLSKEEKSATYLQDEIINSAPENYKSALVELVVYSLKRNLTEGKHQIKVKIGTATGSLAINASSGDINYFKELGTKYRNYILSKRKIPAATMQNAQMEKVALDGFNKKFTGAGHNATKAIITGEWAVIKNEYTGAIMYKNIEATVLYQNKEGQCFYIGIGINQDYEGNGKYGSYYAGSLGLETEISCDKLK